MSSLLYVLGRWTVRARTLVVAIWVGALVILGIGALTLNGGLDDSVSIPGTESGDALERLYATFPEVSGSSAQLIVVGPEGSDITSEPIKDIVNEAVKEFSAVNDVAIATPIDDPLMAAEVNEDGNAALVTIQILADGGTVSDETKDELHNVADALAQNLPEGYESALGGTLFAQEFPTISVTEVLGVVVALIVLFITLGTLIGAGLPLIVGLVGVAASTCLVFIGTAFATINATTPLLSVMLGLAVGIDYSLFIVSRHRDNLKSGLSVTESIGRSLGTSGSAVVFAGITVMIALLGLSVAQIPFLTIMGAAGAIGVGLAVIAACTLLPAILSFAGLRILTKKERSTLTAATPGEYGATASGDATSEDALPDSSPLRATPGTAVGVPETPSPAPAQKPNRFFSGWVTAVTAIPVLTIVVIVAALGALSLPALSMRLALPDAGVLPEDNEARVAYELVDDNFGEGYNGPLIVTAPILTSTDPLGLMDDLANEIRQVPGVADVPMATPNMSADTGIIQVVPEGGPRSAETEQVVRYLRALHDQLEEDYGVDIAVTGMTAVGIDVSAKLSGALLPFAIVVVGLSLVLLTIVFRSIAVPIVAVVGYLLSVTSAFGVVTLVFEDGLFADALGVTALGPIINFMPLVTMGILFGLSMDYQVFLVSRMREDYVHTGKARKSVYTGFLGSAKVVSAAAIIMVSVFAAFVPEGDMNLKPIALGLAVGVAIDAFVVRMGLIPAVMVLLGDKAWWMPHWMDRILPSFDIEGEGVLRERGLKDWPGARATAAVYGLRLEGSPQTSGTPDSAIPSSERTPAPRSEADVQFLLNEGKNLLVCGSDPAELNELIDILAARRNPPSGVVKVLGYLLPQRAGAVKSRVACLKAATNSELELQVQEATQEGAKLLAIYAGPLVDDLTALRSVPDGTPIILATPENLTSPGPRWQVLDLDAPVDQRGNAREPVEVGAPAQPNVEHNDASGSVARGLTPKNSLEGAQLKAPTGEGAES